MLFQKLNRKDAEKVFIPVLNQEGATITAGLPVAFAPGVSTDGISAVVCNAAADFPGFLGIAVQDIANNDYGLVQIAGYVGSVLLSNAGTSITINNGDPLVPAPAGMYSAAPTFANSGFRWVAAGVTKTVSAASYIPGVIRMV